MAWVSYLTAAQEAAICNKVACALQMKPGQVCEALNGLRSAGTLSQSAWSRLKSLVCNADRKAQLAAPFPSRH